MSESSGNSVILLATRSSGKLRELRELLIPLGFRVIDLTEAGVTPDAAEEQIEAFDTFEENARAKAAYFFEKTGIPTVADDSGLAIAALGGAPGVRSKRWSGRTDLSDGDIDAANNSKLIVELNKLPADVLPDAEYVCAAAYHNGTRQFVTVGRTSGRMLVTPRGREGFGYDPYFLSDDLGKTFAEATGAEKHAVSHRGRAFRELVRTLKGILER